VAQGPQALGPLSVSVLTGSHRCSGVDPRHPNAALRPAPQPLRRPPNPELPDPPLVRGGGGISLGGAGHGLPKPRRGARDPLATPKMLQDALDQPRAPQGRPLRRWRQLIHWPIRSLSLNRRPRLAPPPPGSVRVGTPGVVSGSEPAPAPEPQGPPHRSSRPRPLRSGHTPPCVRTRPPESRSSTRSSSASAGATDATPRSRSTERARRVPTRVHRPVCSPRGGTGPEGASRLPSVETPPLAHSCHSAGGCGVPIVEAGHGRSVVANLLAALTRGPLSDRGASGRSGQAGPQRWVPERRGPLAPGRR
jgi:hypothetical protein